MLAAPSCLSAEKHRLIVTADIDGTDSDDEQPMCISCSCLMSLTSMGLYVTWHL